MLELNICFLDALGMPVKFCKMRVACMRIYSSGWSVGPKLLFQHIALPALS